MGYDRDREENARCQDCPQEGDAIKVDTGTVATGAPPNQHFWEEWLDRMSIEQIHILHENNRKKALRAQRRRTLRRVCRIALPTVAVALAIFLCAAPTGRAFANAAIQNITEMVGDFFYLQSAGDGAPAGDEATAVSSAVPDGFEKIQEASQRVQKPVLYIEKENLAVSDVTVEMNDVTTAVEIEYRTRENDSFTTRQKIAKDQAVWGAILDADGKDPQTHVLYNGEILYCTYTREGYAYGGARWGDVSFSISSTTLKWENLLQYVDALACVP